MKWRALWLVMPAVAALLVFSFLPFLPGRYDSVAVPLFGMAQVLGFGGLLLVPIGALWLAFGRRAEAPTHRRFAIAALVVASIVWAIGSLALAAYGTLSLGALAMVLWMSVLARAWRASRQPDAWTVANARAWAIVLVVAPSVVAGAQVAFVGRAIDFSRDRAMRNSEPIIADIERYRAANGRYPSSLLSEGPDYLPGVIGIERYQYEPHGEAYNLIFEQPSNILGTREFVVYNPRDEQVFTAHARDILELSPQQLVVERTRGHYAEQRTTRPHWKYFRFD